MRTIVYYLITWIAWIHDKILTINDSRSFFLTDKQLHFLVIGLLGLLMIFIVYPIFKALAESGHTMVIAWIYVFTQERAPWKLRISPMAFWDSWLCLPYSL